MPVKAVVVAALALYLSHITAYGQGYSESINLGSTRLTLGMSQDAVFAGLAREYTVQKLTVKGKEEFLWGVKLDKSPNSNFVAMLQFANGRLTWISKEWIPEDQIRDFELVTRLHWVLSELSSTGPRTCTVATDKNHGMVEDFKPVEWRSISITCGGAKSVDISVYRDDQSRPYVHLEEIVKERK
jgi:hypothetical protein